MFWWPLLIISNKKLTLFIYLIYWYFSCREYMHTPKNKSCHNYDKESKSRSFLHYLYFYRVELGVKWLSQCCFFLIYTLCVLLWCVWLRKLLYFSEVQEGVVITLDGAQTLFISLDKLVFSLKGREMWVHQISIKCNADWYLCRFWWAGWNVKYQSFK